MPVLRGLPLACLLALAPFAPAAAQLAALQPAPLPLADVMAVAQPYPNLLVEVRLELVRAGLKRDDVVCRGRRFGREWIALEGVRHAPYQCKIGGRTLSIAGRQTYFDANGHRLKPDDPQLPRRAARVVEAGLTWQWR